MFGQKYWLNDNPTANNVVFKGLRGAIFPDTRSHFF